MQQNNIINTLDKSNSYVQKLFFIVQKLFYVLLIYHHLFLQTRLHSANNLIPIKT